MARPARRTIAPKVKNTVAASAKAAPNPSSGNPLRAVTTLTHDQIAQRAYEIWLSKGRPIGLDEQNWTEAETQLNTAR